MNKMKGLIFLTILFSGCVTVEKSEVKEDKQIKLENQDYAWNHKKDHQKWIDSTKEGLRLYGKEMLEIVPNDYKEFCPAYKDLNKEERIQFYTGLVAAMSKRESNFGPDKTYNEKFRNGKGEIVVSTGMLQLSYESARGYSCAARTTTLLKDARLNLHCGIRILNRWVQRDGVLSGRWESKWRGGARYWSVMRNRSSSSSLKYIKTTTNKLKVCKK